MLLKTCRSDVTTAAAVSSQDVSIARIFIIFAISALSSQGKGTISLDGSWALPTDRLARTLLLPCPKALAKGWEGQSSIANDGADKSRRDDVEGGVAD